MKQHSKTKNFSLLFLTLLFANACTKDFKEMNTNPALVSEDLVNPEFLLSGVQAGIGGGMGASDAGNYCGMTVRVDNAPFVDHFDDGAWNATYTSYSNNLAAIIRKTANNPDLVTKKAIARILKVWVY